MIKQPQQSHVYLDAINPMSLSDGVPVAAFDWQGKKIMIVEDDYVNYLYFHEIFSCTNVSLSEPFRFRRHSTY